MKLQGQVSCSGQKPSRTGARCGHIFRASLFAVNQNCLLPGSRTRRGTNKRSRVGCCGSHLTCRQNLQIRKLNDANSGSSYAKHAISIDETAQTSNAYIGRRQQRSRIGDTQGNLYFEPVWFPGVHADIGGGYLENEARLSDAALSWMVAGASLISDGLKHDGSVLRLSPEPSRPPT
ncbi:DUF2235 domain-containing protein [Bradyrhizobium sp. LA6.10]|uniref:T6SS phospholipase effector Tle1-like catalytic domain-containing protein n=1 Tax=Bradyrhizobium sp. LA6.10 TaxID=3156318 RepID=UPI0033975F19